jgi:hypothetical protein
MRAAKLKFKSSSIEWLVLSGPTKAALKGSGTNYKEGGYEFLVSIVDGGTKGGGGDKIRVKIVKKVDARLLLPPLSRLPAANACACAASSVHFASDHLCFPTRRTLGPRSMTTNWVGTWPTKPPPRPPSAAGISSWCELLPVPAGWRLAELR